MSYTTERNAWTRARTVRRRRVARKRPDVAQDIAQYSRLLAYYIMGWLLHLAYFFRLSFSHSLSLSLSLALSLSLSLSLFLTSFFSSFASFSPVFSHLFCGTIDSIVSYIYILLFCDFFIYFTSCCGTALFLKKGWAHAPPVNVPCNNIRLYHALICIITNCTKMYNRKYIGRKIVKTNVTQSTMKRRLATIDPRSRRTHILYYGSVLSCTMAMYIDACIHV